MRGPDRKGVRGLANMTDSHMVGGPRDSSSGAGVLRQGAFFFGVLLGAAGLYVLAAFLGSEDPTLITIAWVVIGLIALTIGFIYLRHRRKRRSLDEFLRSRRQVSNPDGDEQRI